MYIYIYIYIYISVSKLIEQAARFVNVMTRGAYSYHCAVAGLGSFTIQQTFVDHCLRRSWSSGASTQTRWSHVAGVRTAFTGTPRWAYQVPLKLR